jgi:hypothetical protein
MGMSIINSSDEKSSKGILLGGYTHKEVEPQDYDETFWILYLDHEGNENGENI